ncbi:winged helix-turn-helix transcriptional regulator [Candidatus Microgenomates bacterium]|nr:winged helix-turn-helix transcriptional regulator [Candidatus Microgenomates bacterium]
MLTYRQLERIVKGFSNHRRIQMLELINRKPELSLTEISTELKINNKTASEHIRRLAISGLVLKRNRGVNVLHALSPLGFLILKFISRLETSSKEN